MSDIPGQKFYQPQNNEIPQLFHNLKNAAQRELDPSQNLFFLFRRM